MTMPSQPTGASCEAAPAPSSVKAAARTIEAARGRARQFWGVFDRSLVPMVTVDREQRYTSANRAARLLFRLSLAEMRAHVITDFTPPHMRLLLEDAWSRLMTEGSVAGSYDCLFLDGSELRIVYCALAEVLPGRHLIVFGPANWPEDELGVVSAAEVDDGAAPLTAREREILSLIAAGLDLDQIAEELSISLHTVRTHILNAYRKLGANNRAHAIALTMQQGLIELPPGSGIE